MFVIAVVCSVALRQYLVLQGAKVNSRGVLALSSPPTQAQELHEGPPHVLVPEAVDDGIDEGVALSQDQEVLFVEQHLTHVAVKAVEKQHHQAGRPADHKTA